MGNDKNAVQPIGNMAMMMLEFERREANDAKQDKDVALGKQLASKEQQASFKYDSAMKSIDASKTKAWLGVVSSALSIVGGQAGGAIGGLIQSFGSMGVDATKSVDAAKLERTATKHEREASRHEHDVSAADTDLQAHRRESNQLVQDQRAVEDKLAATAKIA